MCLLPTDRRFLQRSIELAEASAAFASPNPTVGCVLTIQEIVVGEGAHRYDDRDHAEIVALKAAAAAGTDVHGATAYVTLEPCSHHGRTGPCADALVRAGISRCVVATMDPNPLVSGQGISRLRAAGLTVVVLEPSDPLAMRARRLNDAFAFSIQHGRPFVTLKSAVSQDGKVAPSPEKRLQREPFWLTGNAAREDVQHLRHRSDVLLTGIGTVLADDPTLTDRTGLPRRSPLLRVVLDADLRTPPGSKLLQTATGDVLLICAGEAPPTREAALRDQGAEVLRLRVGSDGRLDLNFVLATLAAIPARSILIEAGSALNKSFLSHDLVDKLVLYRAPVHLGEDALPFAPGMPLPELESRLTSPQVQSFPNGEAEDQRVTGYLHDPWLP